MKNLIIGMMLLTSFSTTASARIISLTGHGSTYDSYRPLCFGGAGDAKKKAKDSALAKCEAAGGRYLKVKDKDRDCDWDMGGVCACSASVTIECEI